MNSMELSIPPARQHPILHVSGISPKTIACGPSRHPCPPLPSPVRLNCRVHMHFPEAVHLAQSEASQEISEQLLATKISRWLMRQSFSEVQLPALPMQAPSGQLVHHLHWGRACGAQEKKPRVKPLPPTESGRSGVKNGVPAIQEFSFPHYCGMVYSVICHICSMCIFLGFNVGLGCIGVDQKMHSKRNALGTCHYSLTGLLLYPFLRGYHMRQAGLSNQFPDFPLPTATIHPGRTRNWRGWDGLLKCNPKI